MERKRYILYLYEIQKKFSDPGEAAKQLIPIFARNKYVTAYQLYKELNKQKKISYKNVHKRVKKLLEVGIIKEVTNNEPTKHGSILYKLSSFGIYYTFLAINKIDSYSIQKLFENYLNDDLFDKVLFQYIEKKTIKGIKSQFILNDLFKFINRYISNIDFTLKHSLPKVEKEGGYLTAIAAIDSLVDQKMDDYWYGGSKDFINYLRSRFNTKWLKESSKINFNENDHNIIDIIDKKNKLTIKLDKKINKAILYHKQNILFEFELHKISENSFAINEFRPRRLEEYIAELDLFKYTIGSISNFCMQILKYISYENGFCKLEDIEMDISLKLLAKDKRFRNTLQQIKNKIENNFNKFENLSLT